MKKKFIKRLLIIFVPWIAYLYVLIIGWTNRLTFVGSEQYNTRAKFLNWPDGLVYASWHGRFFYYAYLGRRTGVYTMMSPSADAELMARTVRKVGMGAVRGSSSRGGKEAQAEMVKLLKQNARICMLTDGPRGPAYAAKPGAVRLAQLSGRFVLPISSSGSRGVFLPTWDTMFVPFPFGKIAVAVGDPIHVPEDASSEEFTQILNNLNEELIRLMNLADQACGRNPEKEVLKFLKRKKKKKKKKKKKETFPEENVTK